VLELLNLLVLQGEHKVPVHLPILLQTDFKLHVLFTKVAVDFHIYVMYEGSL
jgi:hypothetical protein